MIKLDTKTWYLTKNGFFAQFIQEKITSDNSFKNLFLVYVYGNAAVAMPYNDLGIYENRVFPTYDLEAKLEVISFRDDLMPKEYNKLSL